ncbi:MAG: endonuclease/exonuclease/phosphatase family protein [Pseudomonadota bacterium]
MVGFLALAALAGVIVGYFGHQIFVFDIIAHFRLHMVLLAAGLCAAAAVLFAWRALWWSLAALAMGVAGLSPLWEGVAPTTDGTPVTIVTANLNHQNAAPEDMRAALLASNADVLVTQETTKKAQSGVDPLTSHYPFRLAVATRGSILRTVIWSKFPMRDGRLLLDDMVGPTGASAVIEVAPGLEIGVLGVHLTRPGQELQERQIAALDRLTAGLPRPMVLLGDLNATPWSAAMRRVESLTGARRVPGYRITWTGQYPTPFGPVPAPLGQPIDHILVTEGVGIETIATFEIPGSDHLAVRAVLRLPDDGSFGLSQR